jgi:hypothetical protein
MLQRLNDRPVRKKGDVMRARTLVLTTLSALVGTIFFGTVASAGSPVCDAVNDEGPGGVLDCFVAKATPDPASGTLLVEGSLGEDSWGYTRPNANPCP